MRIELSRIALVGPFIDRAVVEVSKSGAREVYNLRSKRLARPPSCVYAGRPYPSRF